MIIAAASFSASGQQCISAQRVIVEADVYQEFLGLLVKATRALRVGDPEDADTEIGPMISLRHADRVMKMAGDAIQAGGHYALEPHPQPCVVSPGILVDVPPSDRKSTRLNYSHSCASR